MKTKEQIKKEKAFKKILETAGYGFLIALILIANGFTVFFIGALPLLLIKNKSFRNIGLSLLCAFCVIINFSFLFNLGLEKKYFGNYLECELAKNYMWKNYDANVNCKSGDMVFMSAPDYYSLTDCIITEVQNRRISKLDNADVEKLIHQNVNYKSDAERIISNGLGDSQRKNLVRDGKVGWYSSQLGLNILIDIFFLFIAFRYILPKL